MSRIRTYSRARAASVERTNTSHTYGTSGGPTAHGQAHYKPAYGGGFLADANFEGKVYTGRGESRSEALIAALRLAASLRGMPESTVMDLYFGDADPLVGRSY